MGLSKTSNSCDIPFPCGGELSLEREFLTLAWRSVMTRVPRDYITLKIHLKPGIWPSWQLSRVCINNSFMEVLLLFLQCCAALSALDPKHHREGQGAVPWQLFFSILLPLLSFPCSAPLWCLCLAGCCLGEVWTLTLFPIATLIWVFLLSPGDDCHTMNTNSCLQNFSSVISFDRGAQQLLEWRMDWGKT